MEDFSFCAFDTSRLSKASAADYYSSSTSEDDDEYVLPGIDLADDEFRDHNPRKRRRLGAKNKEKATLGVFGSDSDDDGPGRRWKSKTLRSRGVHFVSKIAEDEEANGEKGFVQVGSNSADAGETTKSSDEEVEDNSGGIGLGLGRFSRKVGRAARDAKQNEKTITSQPSMDASKTIFDGSSVLGRGFVPSSAKVPVPKNLDTDAAAPPRNKPQLSTFSSKGTVNAKSFGARMMAKMGYVQGTGLGKELQGRNVIIEANLRPSGVGLGAVKEKTKIERQEEKRQAKLRGEAIVDSDEEEKHARRRTKKKIFGAAADSGSGTPRRQKKKCMTVGELRSAAPGLNIPDAFTPILDLTGPTSNMLTSTSGVMITGVGVTESSEVVEARKLAKRAHADLIAFSEEWKSLEERERWLNLELKEREQEIENLACDFKRLQTFSLIVNDELIKAADWDQAITCLVKAMDLGAITWETADVAVAAIHPFMKDWDPLEEPSRFARDLTGMSSLFIKADRSPDSQSVDKWNSATIQIEGIYRKHDNVATPYESMMFKIWLPQVLAAIRKWDATTPTPMLSLFESWDHLLPPFVRAQTIDSIARKLESALSDWNPRKKRQSRQLPHTWLFPWLPFLPAHQLEVKGSGLVAEVKRKFRQLIDAWEFEKGIVPGLQQWQDVLGDQWHPLIISHVLPSMGRYLQANFCVDPADQEPYLPVLTGVLSWEPMLETALMAEVLVQNVFPMWKAKLLEWLALEEVDLDEVAEWYRWWRAVLLKDLAETTAVAAELDEVLRILNLI